MFARYAYAPNALGYCGPPDAVVLRGGSADEVRAVARRFSGAWPYLCAMSELTGITDPLDLRLVESYWLGGGVGATLDPVAFTGALLARIGPLAGSYWTYLTPDLANEAAADHNFHVFGVYPWTRLLGKGLSEQAVRVLDSCRITWATVLARHDHEITVWSRRLGWDGCRLALSAPGLRRIPLDDTAPAGLRTGRTVALHWDRPCDLLTPQQVRTLATGTARQLRVTNERLSRR
ncbi:DUF6390 family protein [Nocardia pseudobrasiliensis]|uniref:Uncharacterized protein n=1 Tax=Nocardia pseudobrasiliensis TaxID=45979 RepID=A0A370HSX0_9NOCA|nr:DUF6390 family protein [Nocardia pseudobrasiliensis]RDI61608.1 hypothetical protein DFR76_113109 [Nocardia pseudobrasiliensis]